MRILLDTSAWLRLGDLPAEYREAETFAHSLALAEATSVFHQGRISEEHLHVVMENRIWVRVDDVDLIPAGQLHAARRKDNGKSSLADCLMLVAARRLGMPYVTFDHDLRHEEGVMYLGR